MSDQAMKLFEALSDVDEELLERCNRKENKKPGAVQRIAWRYGKAMAACFCLVVVGAAAWAGYRLVTAPYGASDPGSMQNAFPAALADGRQSAGESGGENTSGASPESQASFVTEGTGMESASVADAAASGSNEGTAQPIQDIQSPATVPYMQEQEDALVSGSGKTESCQINDTEGDNYRDTKLADLLDKENAITDSRQLLLWEEACVTEPFNGYMPAFVPEGYAALSARKSFNPDIWNNMIFKWSDGEHILYLDMTLGEPMTKKDLENCDGLYEYIAEEFEREMVPEPIDGQISFTLYYPDGMRIVFGGYLTADEMWEVSDSVLK